VIYTKTFIETRWYMRDPKGEFVEYAPDGQSDLNIDQQVHDWVIDSGKTLIHPGQLGMHTVWHGSQEDPYAVKCLILGLTVLYQDT